MADAKRLQLREIFVSSPKRLILHFYTSNDAKFFQARSVFEHFGIQVHQFRTTHEPYAEDYSKGKNVLLEHAIKEVLETVGKASIFFVEDTSLRIDALSTEGNDVPGLSVKEWFASTSFADLDDKLKRLGKGRGATVSSDVAMHVPGLSRPVYFHGETSGVIADSAPTFPESEQYPWLTPNTFNGWFIPDGANKPLGQMSYEESLAYDFRVPAYEAMASRLEEYYAILNAPPFAYTVKERRPIVHEWSLFPETPFPAFIVVGRVCSGKTTFGEYASMRHSLQYIEASQVVRMKLTREDIVEGDACATAHRLLDRLGPGIVAQSIVSTYGDDLSKGVVITGFRTIEEIECIKGSIPHAKVVLVEASDRVRFERHLLRRRVPSVTTMQDFLRHDEQQIQFGLLRVAGDLADVKIVNEDSLREYHQKIDNLIVDKDARGTNAKQLRQGDLVKGQLFRCLAALEMAGTAITSDEIERLGTASGQSISARHANWLLKDVPELARRIAESNDRIRYQIREAGRAYLRMARKLSESSIQETANGS